MTNQIEAAVYDSAKVVTLDLSHVSEIDSGTADVIKNNLNFVKKNGRDAVILYANVSPEKFLKVWIGTLDLVERSAIVNEFVTI